jgi:PhoH-like ATPase
VIEELDGLKKGQDTRNVNSRKATRDIAKMIEGKNPTNWIKRGDTSGKFKISLHIGKPKKTPFNLDLSVPDNRILAAALHAKETTTVGEVILVTKDANLRIKAQAHGVKSEDWLADYAEVEDILSSSEVDVECDCPDFINEIFTLQSNGNGRIPMDKFKSEFAKTISFGYKNIHTEGGDGTLLHVSRAGIKVFREGEFKAVGISPKNTEQEFSMHALLDPKITLVALTGKAGTGKTLLALAVGILRKKRNECDSVLLARPIVPLGNRDLGYLPGGVNEKIGPYMQPLFDNLGVIKKAASQSDKIKIDDMSKNNSLEILPLAYVRGRSLQDMFIIVDESQNLTPHEVKTIVTRAAEGTKIIFTGDIKQIDPPYLSEYTNGLSHLIAKMKNQSFFSHIHLVKGERSSMATIAADLL